MKRSDKQFPIDNNNLLLSFLKKMWEEGWLDDYSDNHFLIRAIENRLTDFLGKLQLNLDNYLLYPISDKNSFVDTFLINFSTKLNGIYNSFDKKKIKKFVTDQLSAGKSNYNEEQFFSALSEISVIAFYNSICSWKNKIYEPKTNGKKNPEVRFVTQNDIIVDIEVKTPGFVQNNIKEKKLMPTVLLTEEGRLAVAKHCENNKLKCLMPRIDKLKDYINSAAIKFEIPTNNNHLNLLYINWSYSEFAPDAYLEAYYLLINPFNGIIRNKKIGKKIGILEEAYDKISAIIVYSDSLNGLAFMDLRYIWINQKFRMIALNPNINYKKYTGMNADPDPNMTMCVLGDEETHAQPKSPTMQAIPIIQKYILQE